MYLIIQQVNLEFFDQSFYLNKPNFQSFSYLIEYKLSLASNHEKPALKVVYVILLSNLMDRRCERASWFLNGVFKVYHFIWHAKILFFDDDWIKSSWQEMHGTLKRALTEQSSKWKYKNTFFEFICYFVFFYLSYKSISYHSTF